MSETLLVTGASGQLGRLVLDDLLASGKIAASSIIATTRDVAKLADYAEKGVTVCKPTSTMRQASRRLSPAPTRS